jgi:hypothetical protein
MTRPDFVVVIAFGNPSTPDRMGGRGASRLSFAVQRGPSTRTVTSRIETRLPDLRPIDVGVYVVATKALHKATGKAFDGSVMFEKVERYLPHFKSAIQVPIWVIGLLPS